MKTGALTITRGNEREIFKPQLHRNVHKQKLKIDAHIIIDYPPKTANNDMFERMKLGVESAINVGVEWLYVFEDDDYYSEEHTQILRKRKGKHLAGINSTTYYHIKNHAFRTQTHHGRASLFATAFNPLYAIDFFKDHKDSKFIDADLWKWASHKDKILIPDVLTCTGIKHGVGLCGGMGHKGMNYANDDTNLSFMKSRIDEDAFKFYNKIKL